MKHLTNTTHFPELAAQGASEVITDGMNRVTLWTDHTPHYQGRAVATIGGCVLDDPDMSVSLVKYAAEYLSERFATVIAPMNGSTWLEHRLVTYSDGSAPFALEPSTPPEWGDIFQRAGFQTLSEYSSSRIVLGAPNPRFRKLEDKAAQRGVRIRAMNPARFSEDLSAIYDLSLEGFKHNFLYTPLPRGLFIGKYQKAREMLDPELILLAEVGGQLAGFVFCYPGEATAETLIVKTLASSAEYGFSGIGNLLVERVQNIAREKGYRQAIHALQFSDNSSLRITARYNPTVIRRYALVGRHF